MNVGKKKSVILSEVQSTESKNPESAKPATTAKTIFTSNGFSDASIADFTELSLERALTAAQSMRFTGREHLIADRLQREIIERLEFLNAVGLGYLSLSRSAATISGGEGQRIRLATQIGSKLRGVLYVLDEPSIGLHPRDNQRPSRHSENLRDLGNFACSSSSTMKTPFAKPTTSSTLGPGATAKTAAMSSPQARLRTS